ncbi:Dirigent protein [Rhynchospora pubera]|uniref:Dirigent protein n=1 Tax=Rhynchospora pubera TaxID=906938 RepID=A0AAV8D6D1_9POAL|nr:Dirigent protein [Rhynchospora pubera]KAJ4814922.1 Dirigent protein [Rhynchospora pubera]
MASSLSQTVFFSILLLLSLHQASAKKTHLHFYFHEILSGPNATVMTVVNPSNNTNSFTFGAIAVIDDLLLEGQDDNSTLIGRAQGLVGAVGRDGSLESMLNFVFTKGKYNGSTLAIYGRVVQGVTIERPVIGGTGMFRMATGYSVAKPVDISATKLVYEFDVYVWHKKMKDN